MSNYATKADLKNATGVDTSNFGKKTDLASSKFDVDKLDTDKLKNAPSNLSNLKSKQIRCKKLVPVPVDLSKLSDVVNNDVVKRTKYNELVEKVNNINTNTTNLVKNLTITQKLMKFLKKLLIMIMLKLNISLIKNLIN